MCASGLHEELAALLDDPRWLIGTLEHIGPARLEADLLLSGQARHRALAVVVRQNAHVLGRLDPPGSLTATFASRIPDSFPDTELRARLLATINGSYLTSAVEPPDLPHPALSRVLTGHTNWVTALVVAPDGSWLASASDDATARSWDPTTGQPVASLRVGHPLRSITHNVADQHIYAGGDRGPYILSMHAGPPARPEPRRPEAEGAS
ncbi:MAG: hypothetical protein JO100_05125 [Pseudonocardia sp.]|nr:hypothetical protein [Pseudonocardia sp.]